MGKNKDSTLRLRPLSASEFKLKISILQQIGDFWTHFKFPLQDAGSLPEIKAWLGEAAEYSILIKKYLEKLGQGKTLRLVPGSVQEYLLNLEAFPADSRVFVKEVVHALFSNKGGYISKAVTKDFLDKHVDLLNKQIARKDSKAREEIQQYEKEVKETWNESNKLAQDIFALVESLSLSNPAYARQLVKVLHNVQGLKAQLAKFHETLKNEKETSEEAASETSSTADGDKEDDLAADEMAVDLEHLKSQEGDIKITNEELHPPQPEEPAAEDAAMQTDGAPVAHQPSPANDSALRRVASEVGHIQEGLQSISRDIEVLKVEDLVANPSQNRKFVDNLHHRCVAFSEGLMKDLYTLDELSLSQEERPKRKEQVKKIQSLVTTVDTLLAKLHELIEVVKVEEAKQAEEQARKAQEEAHKQEVHKPEAKKPEAEKPEAEKKVDLVKKPEELREEMIPTPKPEELERIFQEALQESLKKKLKTELDLQKKKEEFEPELASQARRLEPFWRRMKLKPKVNVEQASDGYLISSYIPGMRSEDVQISVVQEGNTPVLAVRGHRSPSVEELALLRRQLARSGIESDDESVLRLGFGRFGTFLEKFAIPENVDLRRISGGYEGGELRVILPKAVVTRPARPAVPAYDPGFYWW